MAGTAPAASKTRFPPKTPPLGGNLAVPKRKGAFSGITPLSRPVFPTKTDLAVREYNFNLDVDHNKEK